jgi:hypothetical protein
MSELLGSTCYSSASRPQQSEELPTGNDNDDGKASDILSFKLHVACIVMWHPIHQKNKNKAGQMLRRTLHNSA